jgi:hypothetical protein
MLLGCTEFTKVYLQIKDNPWPYVNLATLVQNARMSDREVIELGNKPILLGNIPRGFSCRGFNTNTSTSATISSTITIGTAIAAYDIVPRFCVTVLGSPNPDSFKDSRPALKLLANIQNPTAGQTFYS